MILRKWEQLPPEMQVPEVRKYYDILRKKRAGLFFKRVFDIVVSGLMLVFLSPVFLCLAIAIKIDSKGPVFFRQERITQYNRKFRIFKFRSMVHDADKGGSLTVANDDRITRMGKFMRDSRLDEISQLIDVFKGTMTFVGTRPEVLKYVDCYTPEMMATLLLPAGVTSLASIYYKNEAELFDPQKNVDVSYIEDVLPVKMHYNLQALEHFSFWGDIKIMFMTVFAVLGKEYKSEFANRDTVPNEIKEISDKTKQI